MRRSPLPLDIGSLLSPQERRAIAAKCVDHYVPTAAVSISYDVKHAASSLRMAMVDRCHPIIRQQVHAVGFIQALDKDTRYRLLREVIKERWAHEAAQLCIHAGVAVPGCRDFRELSALLKRTTPI